MPSKLPLLIVPLFVMLSGFFSWNYIRNTPQYSIYQINQAVKNRDYRTFSKYVDSQAIIKNTMDRMVTQAQSELKSQDCSENVGTCLKDMFISQLTPSSVLVTQVKQSEINNQIKDVVEKGSYFDPSFNLDSLLVDLSKLKPIKSNDKMLITLVNDKSQKLYVQLIKENGLWRAVDVSTDPQNPYSKFSFKTN